MLQVLKSGKTDSNALAQVKWAWNLKCVGFLLKREKSIKLFMEFHFLKISFVEKEQTFNIYFNDTEEKWKLT